MTNMPANDFYQRQVEYLENNDVDGLIANQYADDAIIVSFDFQHRGKEALHKHFIEYLKTIGGIKVLSTDKFTQTPDSIFFEATVKVAGGIAKVYDVFMLRDGKATHHFTGLLSFTPA